MSHDPAVTNPELYRVLFENDRVRVLEYRDMPGDSTAPHRHPDTVMYPLASFARRLTAGRRQVEVKLEPGQVRWLDAQEHSGENIGSTPSHALFFELKDPPTPPSAALGPTT
ncbi:cupin domain-containing protein [Nonomuraea sp. NPDC050536]|uniref:cupin domain-containing protein n=1 Tax=Nonomuraea sp. NPDC050536 TaxID=3364366 RepID=UPI0037C8D9DC